MSEPEILRAARCIIVVSNPGKTKYLTLIPFERNRDNIRDRVTVNFLQGSGDLPMVISVILSSNRIFSPSICEISPSVYSSLLITDDCGRSILTCCDAEKLFPAEKEVPEDNKKNSSNIP